jgi:uncharacterized protein (TIGR03067 family)
MLLGLAVSGLFAVGLLAGEGGGGKTEKLEGTWLCTSSEMGGKKFPADVLEKIRMTLEIRGDKYKLSIMGRAQEEGTFKTDPKKDPKTIDLMVTSGQDKSKTHLGIYRLDGDTLSVSLSRPGAEERPSAFRSEQGSYVKVYVLKRQKDAESKKETKGDK